MPEALEAGTLQDFQRQLGAASAAAVNDDFPIAGLAEFGEALRQLIVRQVVCSGEMAGGVLLGGTHIEQQR